jgi:competence protein ComEA
MSTLQNLLGSCVVFNAVNRCAQRGVLRSLFSGFVALMLCHSALALDINHANEAELDSVKGMGPALSAKVIKARELGAFKDWQDLMQRVSGVRQNKAQQFSDQGLTVNGQPFGAKR